MVERAFAGLTAFTTGGGPPSAHPPTHQPTMVSAFSKGTCWCLTSSCRWCKCAAPKKTGVRRMMDSLLYPPCANDDGWQVVWWRGGGFGWEDSAAPSTARMREQ